MTEDLKNADFLARFASVGSDVEIFQHALILSPELISVGDGVRIDDYARLEGGTGVSIDAHVHIASFASILGGGGARLGAFVGLAQGARIITGTGHPSADHFPSPAPRDDPFHRHQGAVRLGDFSFVGANAVVLPDLAIDEGGVVAAGSVVTKDVSAWTVVAGVPARPIRVRDRFV